MFGSILPSSILYEFGHTLGIELAGREPEFHILDKLFNMEPMYVSYSTDKLPEILQNAITVAGPLTNAALSAVTLGASTKVKNKKLSYALKGTSLANALYLGLYSLSDYMGITHEILVSWLLKELGTSTHFL